MSRKDKKNRNLNAGEYQQKSGRYEYRYKDLDGRVKSVYSWRLVDTDRAPSGKKHTDSLRTMEYKIRSNMNAGVLGAGSDATLNEEFDYWMESRMALPPDKRIPGTSSLVEYKYIFNRHVRDTIGRRKIKDITRTDLVDFYISKITKNGVEYNRIKSIHEVIKKCFFRCEENMQIRYNPCDGALERLKRAILVDCSKKKKKALTTKEQNAFISELKKPENAHAGPILLFMLGTGCRVGEAAGLTWDDVDFSNNTISINHQLAYLNLDGSGDQTVIAPCKSSSANRAIPMINGVRQCLLDLKDYQEANGIVCDQVLYDYTGRLERNEYKGFVFLNSKNRVFTASNLDTFLRRMVDRHNRNEATDAEKNYREPVYLPPVTCHTLRHTFITRFAEVETNIKVIQEIAGHSDFKVTMNIYNEAQDDLKQKAIKSLSHKLIIL